MTNRNLQEIPKFEDTWSYLYFEKGTIDQHQRERISQKWNLNAIMIFSTNTEQSFGIMVNGDPERSVVDFDGISLLSKPVKKRINKQIGE